MVEAELDRLVCKGHIVKFYTWEELTEVYQVFVVLELAAITKVRPDGTVKLRLIVDMLRSGLSERIVPPRIRDVVSDLRSLLVQSACSRAHFGRVLAACVSSPNAAGHGRFCTASFVFCVLLRKPRCKHWR